MIITCEQCQARFRMADEKLKPGGTKVRCSKCKSVFTVFPAEDSPAEEVVDYGDFNMERVAEDEPAPSYPAAEPTPAAAAVSNGELDFSSLEQTLDSGSGASEIDEEFSFADTSAPAEPAEPAAAAAPAAVEAFGELDFSDTPPPGELDFDATFAESDQPPGIAAGAAEFSFDEEAAGEETAGAPDEPGVFSFDSDPASDADETISFGMEAARSDSDAFGFGSVEEEGFAFGEEAVPATGSESTGFDLPASPETSPFEDEPDVDDRQASVWDQPGKETGPSFDFDEPNFGNAAKEPPKKVTGDSSLSFGEIDFAEEEGGVPPTFGAEPDFSQATLARPSEPEMPMPSHESAARPASGRPRHDEPLPTPAAPRKSSAFPVLLTLILLLLGLCGAGGYFYFMGNGQQVIDRLLLKLKGEEPVAPVEQRIGLNIVGSSYIDNRDAGQLLIIQGTAANNFAGARSALTVKGLLLNADGKILQQQTVFCGNYLSDEKLRNLKYTQIEEAMNNQFGDSLSNMNLKPGATIRFTIVFRNPPKDLANINVEVVDSKPGGL